jgi:hypothetical protein
MLASSAWRVIEPRRPVNGKAKVPQFLLYELLIFTMLTRSIGSRKHFEPYLPLTHLEDLIAALKEAHQRLITPPPKIQADPAKAAAWKPRVRPKVDWDEVRMSITGGHAYIAPLDNPLKFDEGGEGDEEGAEDRAATEPLTIGLIGTFTLFCKFM